MLLSLAITALAQRDTIPLNRDWLFRYGDPANASARVFDDSDWEKVSLPHDFQISQPWIAPDADERPDTDNPMANVRSRLSSRGFKEMGTGWYRKTFVPGPSWEGRRVLLDFEGIMLVGDVYLNGEHIGATNYGYLGFETDITGKLKFGEQNVIAVKADTGKPENSRWYTGGGLYRDVKFVVTPPNRYFTRHPLHVTTPVAEKDSAIVIVEAGIFSAAASNDNIRTRLSIIDPQGNVIATDTASFAFEKRKNPWDYTIGTLRLRNPQRWSCETPALYTAMAELLDSTGNVTDRVSTTFGIRKIEFSPDFGFRLNGEKVFLKGIANHHTMGALGAAAFPAAIEKRIKLLKDFGFNHIRTSHNPYSESFLDLCDRQGILVLDELYDKWLTQYAGGREEWTDQWQHTIPEWIKRDRNHPSVIIWSLGNELQISPETPYNDYGVTPYLMQRPLVKRFDATRPLTVAMHPHGRGFDLDSEPWELAKITDIASYNYRYMFFPNDGKRYPHMNFYQSEASAAAMGPNFFDLDQDHNIGLAYWGMIDYLGESNGWPDKGWHSGVFDISLEPKPTAWFLRSFYKPREPMVHISVTGKRESLDWNGVDIGTAAASDSWNLPEGSSANIYTYTNADEVELIVNGKSLGRKPNNIADSRERNRILWPMVAYHPGYIEARAFASGETKPVAVYRIETTGEATRLNATPDNAHWQADGTDLQHIRVTAVDKAGRRVPYENSKVCFRVDGPAEIAGVINGDISTQEIFSGNSHTLYQGTLCIILRSTPEAGQVTLTISSPTLKPAKLTLQTRH